MKQVPLEKIDDFRWRVPKSFRKEMLVEGIIYSDDSLIESVIGDKSAEQVANVACLPGIVKHSLAMPDIHWGYGFCIGGVAATDPEEGGVISPGGVGYDINCGVRLLRTNLEAKEIAPFIEKLVFKLFATIPCGTGQEGRFKFERREMKKILEKGSEEVIRQGLGWNTDIEMSEASGVLEGSDPDEISDRALERGKSQCGTLGSGNHFIEIQEVKEIFLPEVAVAFGLRKSQIVIMIHSGSRGLGYQVCEDAISDLRSSPEKHGIHLPDPQLICAPIHSKEGQRYLRSMKAAANFAWANRQIMTHLVRDVFSEILGRPSESLEMSVLYDVSHNIAKMERYDVDGEEKLLCVHRKGATRAFPKGHPEVPEHYRGVGQPVLIPGDMGRASYVLVGEPGSLEHTFGSSCHGAGRRLSRHAAVKAAKGRSIRDELKKRGVIALARGRSGLEEEHPDAYKDVNAVVNIMHQTGISSRVAKLVPLGVIKG